MSARADGVWLEPLPGRQAVKVRGQEAREAQRLNPGDTFQLGEVSFQFQV